MSRPHAGFSQAPLPFARAAGCHPRRIRAIVTHIQPQVPGPCNESDVLRHVRANADHRRGARPDAGRGRGRHRGRGQRRVSQRLARLDGARSRHPAAARPRPRAGRPGRRHRPERPALQGRRQGDGAVRLGLRPLRGMPLRQPAGLPGPVPAGLHPLGLVRPLRRHRLRRDQSRYPARQRRRRHGRQPRLAGSPPRSAPSSTRRGCVRASGSPSMAAAGSGCRRS